MLLASLRHIREIGPESNIYCLPAFELFFFFFIFIFFICLFLRSGIYPEFKNWRVLIIWIGISVQQGIHVPAEMSLKANLYYQLYEMIPWDCNVLQLQVLHLCCGVRLLVLPPCITSLSRPSVPDTWTCSGVWIQIEARKNDIVSLGIWLIYWIGVIQRHSPAFIQPSSLCAEGRQVSRVTLLLTPQHLPRSNSMSSVNSWWPNSNTFWFVEGQKNWVHS